MFLRFGAPTPKLARPPAGQIRSPGPAHMTDVMGWGGR